MHHHLILANELLTVTCQWEAHTASCKAVTVAVDGSVHLTLGHSHTHTHTRRAGTYLKSSEWKVRVETLKTIPGLSNPTWLLILMLFTADLIRDFCLPSRSTWVVAGFRRLNQQLYTSSSKPVELGHDERVFPHKKKSRVTGKERGILLVVISCCAPPSVALWWPTV